MIKYLFLLLMILSLTGCEDYADKCAKMQGNPEVTGHTRIIPISHCAYHEDGCTIYYTYITEVEFKCVLENGTVAFTWYN